jgi:hypothetical protein
MKKAGYIWKLAVEMVQDADVEILRFVQDDRLVT